MDRSQQVKKVFQSALERERTQRPAFLDEACAGDEALRNEVESLVASHEQAENVIHEALSEYAVESSGRQRAGPVVGSSVGPYQLLGLLGKGGMGEVYRARDTRLGREVAIKVLASEFCSDPGRLKRFEREASAASALNHPNIVTIHEFGHSDSVYYICMELVVGKTLRQVLRTGALPVKKALHIAVQLADGLAKAHDAGITHRDLKPDNVMITKEGLVKILDFGLAKLSQDFMAEGSEVGTATTRPGTVLGTVGYMSPEQASGREVDFRSDQFSFGAVVYEMLTGKRAFHRASAAETLTAIIREGPVPIMEVNASAPPFLRWIVERCLEKDPEDRYASTRDLASELQGLREHSSDDFAALVAPDVSSLRRRERLAWAAAGVLLLVSLAAFLIIYFRGAPATDVPPVRFFVSPPEKMVFTSLDGPVAISPDGRSLAFVCTNAEHNKLLWVRPLNSLTAKALPGTEDAYLPFWSPDSRFLGFFSQGKLKKIEVSGGPPQTICEAPIARGGSWSRDGVIIFSPKSDSGLYAVPEHGGPVMPVTTLDPSRKESSHRYPYFLPDGRHFLYVVRSAQPEHRGIYAGSLDSGGRTERLLSADSSASYAAPGYLLFVRAGALLAQPFDISTLQFKGEPILAAEQVAYDASELRPEFSVSDRGVLSYRNADIAKTQLIWFDRTGKQLETIGAPGAYRSPCLSPDEKQVALDLVDPLTGTRDIWIFELLSNKKSRFTFNPANDKDPLWSPDGRRIVFASEREGLDHLFQKASSGAGSDEMIYPEGGAVYPSDWSPDGKLLLCASWAPKTNWDLLIMPLSGGQKPFPFLATEFDEAEAQFSPDGRWVAYASNESGTNEVYVRSFLSPGGKWQISTKGGGMPRWRRDGRELYYIGEGNKILAVTIKEGSRFEAGVPKPLFETRINSSIPARNHYVVSADGQRFLINAMVEKLDHPPITVVLNWARDLPGK